MNVSTKIQNSEKSHKFIIVPNLSADCILGMDYIENLDLKAGCKTIVINNEVIPLHNPDHSQIGKLVNSVHLRPNNMYQLEVKNPFYNDSSIDYVLADKLDSVSDNRFQVTPTLVKNNQTISVCVTTDNKRHGPMRINQKVCSISPGPSASRVNAITVVNHRSEQTDCQKFQAERLRKFGVPSEIKVASVGKQLTACQNSKILKLLNDNHLSFARNSNDVGHLSNFKFSLPMHDENDTAYQPPRPIPPALQEKVRIEIDKFKDLGIIEETQSGFNIPLVIVKKPDGSIRVSLDARELNTKLVDDRWPLPTMSELLSRVSRKLSRGQGCYVSSFDINKAYWTLPVNKRDKHKLAFSYENKHYCANRMLYGIKTAPAAWFRVVSSIFKHPDILVYLDDTLIISSTFDEHVKALDYVLKQCQHYGLTLSPNKTNICAESLEFLGHHIDKNGIKPTEKHKNALLNFPLPKSRNELKRFCGMANFNSKFIKNASVTLSPLHKLCSNRIPFIWTDEHTEAFDSIKRDMLSTNGLKHFNPDLPLYLSSDASQTRCGSVLYQLNKNIWEPIGYFSRVFTAAEQRASSRHRELYALVYAIRNFEYYLIGRKFVSVVDHKSLLYLFKEHMKTKLNNRLVNCFVYLQSFDMSLIHKPGESPEMASADALSRMPVTNFELMEAEAQIDAIPDKIFLMEHLPSQSEFDMSNETRKQLDELVTGDKNNIPVNENIVLRFGEYSYTTVDMVDLQSKCSFVKNISQKLKLRTKSASPKYKLIDGIIYRTTPNGSKLLLPHQLLTEFLSYSHHLYVHPGAHKLAQIISRHVYIPDIISKCQIISKNCLTCLQSKPMKRITPSQIKRHAYDCVPFSKSAMDLYDLGVSDSRNKRYLLVIVDHLTGFIDGFPLSAKTDQQVSLGLTEIFLRHGVTGCLISDNGMEFQGPLVRKLIKAFNIQHSLTSAYHSRSNGLVERMNRDILIKQKLLSVNRKSWSYSWPYIAFILNNTPRERLDGLTASECYYGRSLYHPITVDTKIDDPSTEPFTETLSNYINELLPALTKFQLDRQNRAIKAKNEMTKLPIGSFVLAWMPKVVNGKLSRMWMGPLRVIKNYSASSYIVRDPITRTTYKRGLRHLRPCGSLLSDSLKTKFPEEAIIETENEAKNEVHDFTNLPFCDL